MSQCYTIVPAAPVRASASHKAEIVSQLLFGETATILDKEGEFLKIACNYDHYEGWVQDLQVCADNEGPSDTRILLATAKVKSNLGNLLLSPGSLIATSSHWEVGAYNFSHDIEFSPEKTYANKGSQIVELAMQYLGASYLWGGKSIFGLDCSGFSQMVYKMSGVFLRRDAWQQAEQGREIGFLQEAKPGDLAFFDNQAGRINHVGILTSTDTIIHSSAKVRHDPIDHQGIMNKELKIRTHNLRFIKRYFD